MYAALIRATEQWRGIKVTTFDRKQGEVIREELVAMLDQRHAMPSASPRRNRQSRGSKGS